MIEKGDENIKLDLFDKISLIMILVLLALIFKITDKLCTFLCCKKYPI